MPCPLDEKKRKTFENLKKIAKVDILLCRFALKNIFIPS